MKKFALFYWFRDFVPDPAIAAGIAMHGRATLAYEEDAWWMYGVQPGAIAESGESPRAAYLNLCRALRKVVLDCAEDASDFASFKTSFERFFEAKDAVEEREWIESAQAVRQGALRSEGELTRLPIKKLELPGLLVIEEIGEEMKEENARELTAVNEELHQAA